MNGPDRFEGVHGEGDPNLTGSRDGVDPLTGLPVLVYEFEGEPLARPGELESEHIPRILWSGPGRLITAFSDEWVRLDAQAGPLAPTELLHAATALRDAAAAGVPHGDIRPERLLREGPKLLIEGYGLPWRPEPGAYAPPEAGGTLAGDVWSLAATVQAVGIATDDETVVAVLTQCLAHDPNERPSAEELFLALEALFAEDLAAVAGDSADDPDEAVVSERVAPDRESADRASADPPAADPASADLGSADPPSGDVQVEDAPTQDAPADETRDAPARSDAAAGDGVPQAADPPAPRISRIPASTASTDGWWKERRPEGSEAKEPEPPVVERESNADGRRRLALLGVLMAAVIILALLAVYGPRGSGAPPVAATLEDTVYVVEVSVAPDDLPPVDIHLIASPPDSSLARGDRLGTAPRYLALDRPGTWAFQGSLQGRRSPVVEIQVPEQRSLTLTIPEEGQ